MPTRGVAYRRVFHARNHLYLRTLSCPRCLRYVQFRVALGAEITKSLGKLLH